MVDGAHGLPDLWPSLVDQHHEGGRVGVLEVIAGPFLQDGWREWPEPLAVLDP